MLYDGVRNELQSLLHYDFALMPLVAGLMPGFVVAFILDVFVVEIIERKLILNYPSKMKISCTNFDNLKFDVLGMVTFMHYSMF